MIWYILRMKQRFKTVYFPDPGVSDAGQKNLKLAFSERDDDIYNLVHPISSHDVRQLLGFAGYEDLRKAAGDDDLPLNTFCMRLLRQRCRALRESSVQYALPGLSPLSLPFSPIHATFKGGEKEPLHLWYPFLEGYSPSFVREVLQQHAPEARRVLDPFAGTGTTPLTAARMSLNSFYCELNPLLQFLIQAKFRALTLTSSLKQATLDILTQISADFGGRVTREPTDGDLDLAHARVFGRSVFFAQDVYQQVLRSRQMIDKLQCTSPVAAELLTVAVVSSLVPASLLIRRGDLRFKTAEEAGRHQAGFIDIARSQLDRIIADLELHGGTLPNAYLPALLCEDARSLGRLPSQSIDCVVTSPPYLNGTNYFRNTKLELWFLRCLRMPDDLVHFRERAVTAGINDVSPRKGVAEAHPAVQSVVDQLAASAYDRRIPIMVRSYFEDMRAVFAGIRAHLTPQATIAIDIGDSIYGGVSVPTDAILSEVLSDLGFEKKDTVLLRRRLSRNGGTLRQVLMLFSLRGRYPGLAERRSSYGTHQPKQECAWRTAPNVWAQAWSAFRKDLPHQQDPFHHRNWGHRLHSLCSYDGKMKPSLAYHLIRSFVPPFGAVLDPFAGVGTIPFEAALHGVRSYSFEISPAAYAIATAKLHIPDPATCRSLLNDLASFIRSGKPTQNERESARSISFNKPLPTYYHAQTLDEVLLARRYFMNCPPGNPSQHLVFASLLHILHGNRPYALSRRSHPITPFAPTGPDEYRALIPRLHDKVERSLAADYPTEFAPGQVYRQDATSWWPQEVSNIDAVVTSPPFYDSTRFYLSNWLRLWFCGWEAADFHSKPLAFIDERQKQTFAVYESVFRQARERLKPDGVMVLHLGKSRKCDMAEVLAHVAAPWFDVADRFSESVSHCETHGIRDKGAVKEHQYLVLV